MHVQGVYETQMSTEAFNTVEERSKIISERSNTKMGDSAFQDEKAKVSAAVAESSGMGVDAQLGAPVAQVRV